MDKYKITVFTATFNRKKLLLRLYESLKEQNFRGFEWIIYDDGSEDGTKELIEEFSADNNIDIKYIYSQNRGKHVGINKGSDLSEGELFFIVDSDDYLPKDSLESIWKVWSSIDKNQKDNFIGVGGRKYSINSENNKFNFDSQYEDCNSIEFALIKNNIQDKAEVYVTKKMREYKFPEFDDENFLTEALVWYKMAEDGYKIRWFNKDIYICEYLDDGLSRNYYKKRIDNILGTCYSYNVLSSYNLPKKYKIRYKSNYFRYGLHKYSLKELLGDLKNKEHVISAITIGSILNMIDKVKFKRRNV